jgi:hypothetical protein
MAGLYDDGLALGVQEEEDDDDDRVAIDLGLADANGLLLLIALLLEPAPPKAFSLNSRPNNCSCGDEDADKRYLTKSL